MEELVSVIVPVYNAEKYLGKCIDSILNQTYKNLELILVNDGSKDNSLTICEDKKKTDSRVVVVSKDNSGVSDTRNKGIEAANGKYIIFVDSDDFLEPECIETAVNAISDCDLVVFGYSSFGKNEQTVCPGVKKVVCFKDDEDLFFNLVGNYLINQPWNKMYRKEKIKQGFDRNFTIGEDCLFNLNYIMGIDKVSVIPDSLYNYNVQNVNSILKTKVRSFENYFDYWQRVFSFCSNYFNTQTSIEKTSCLFIKSTVGQLLAETRNSNKQDFILAFNKYRDHEMVDKAIRNYKMTFKGIRYKLLFYLFKRNRKRTLFFLRAQMLRLRGKK